MLPFIAFSMLTSLAIGTTITLSSYHWFLAWIGLEINTLAIIPLMTITPHPRAIEAATKYFLTQASASITLLFSAMLNYWMTGEWNILNTHPMVVLLITLALTMKLGIAPLHFWMPEVLQGVSLKTGLIVSTWQKIAPMMLMYQMSMTLNTNLMLTLGLISVLIGGWGIINQTELRKMLAYSSIGHLGWTFIIFPFNPGLALLNFFLYLIMSITVFTAFNATHQTKISELSTSWSSSPTLASTTMLTLMSLSGLPPMSGFIPKLLIIMYLVNENFFILATILIMISLLATYMYIRLTYFMTMILSPNNTTTTTNWRPLTKYHPTFTLSAIFSLMLIPVLPTMMALI